MRLAIEGALLSRDYLAHSLADLCRDGQISADPDRFTASRRRVGATLGPTAGAALVFDVAAVPLAKWLGWEIAAGGPVHVGAGAWTVLIQSGCRPSGLMVVGWNWRPGKRRQGGHPVRLEQGLRFVLVTNGRVLRLTDATRPATHAALRVRSRSLHLGSRRARGAARAGRRGREPRHGWRCADASGARHRRVGPHGCSRLPVSARRRPARASGDASRHHPCARRRSTVAARGRPRRRSAHRRLPDSVSPVCGGAASRSDVAPGLSGRLHARGAPIAHRSQRRPARHVGSASRDCEAGPRRMRGRGSPRCAVQWPPVRAQARRHCWIT